MPDTAARLRAITASHFGGDADGLAADTSFFDDLGADSLDTVEFAMAVEDEFRICISDDEAAAAIEEEGACFGALLKLVEAKLAGKGEGGRG